jgi:hypothetical protein
MKVPVVDHKPGVEGFRNNATPPKGPLKPYPAVELLDFAENITVNGAFAATIERFVVFAAAW